VNVHFTKKAVAIAAEEVFPEGEKPSIWGQKWVAYAAMAAIFLSFLAVLQITNVLPQVAQKLKNQINRADSNLAENIANVPENVSLNLDSISLEDKDKTPVFPNTDETSLNSEIKVKTQSRNVYRSSAAVTSDKQDSLNAELQDDQKKSGKDVSSRFDLVYRLGVPYRSN